ncbi:uncharacterized protein LAESUDRAFT_815734 [Laetiporus sulphureus 93-53]|uniref:F-box domain-containing protein n=1 Tax=Laetiporus sulphureus 93-53 TaxID=1314785 RepID=A0A165BUG1_9APHY|nr:uncharacterized protein LAESUDRAFT_815734 [Laetiporus sulphureus 93-53]KZT01673.1 hypothetical protein LAESUDRAFT_815734 [Laetiporus sulphureus 93-53]
MSHQNRGKKTPSLEELSASDLMKMRFSKLEQKDPHECAREDLEELIKAAVTPAVQAMRRERNAHVAINRLPAEVLREIFVTTCTVKLAEYRSEHYQCYISTTVWNPTWIDKGRAVSLMLVCHHWKEIALEIQELWSGIETYWEDEDHILLERSGRGPLKVLACCDPLYEYAVTHALQNVEHSSRIQELYWIWPLTRHSREHLGMPAPSLRSLALQNWTIPDGSLKLFDDHTPCLERLSLSNVNWLPSNAFVKLTFLALETCMVSKLPIKLRSLLAGTPNLVDLVLRNVSDSSYPHIRVEIGAAGMKPVSLTRLRRLLIEEMWSDDIDYVFRDAQLNEDASVSIAHTQRDDDEQRLPEGVSSWSLNALKQPKELHFQSHVAIVVGASSGFRFEVWRCTTLEDWMAFNWPRILPLSSISHLCMFELKAYKGRGLERVRNLLRQMTTLQTLSVNIDGLTQIVDIFTLFRDPTGPPLCPALTTLRIVIHHDRDCDIILHSILPRRAQLGIKHLDVGLIDPWSSEHWRPRQSVKKKMHGKFESMNFETLLYDKAYNITLPLVCSEEAHRLWPPWL